MTTSDRAGNEERPLTADEEATIRLRAGHREALRDAWNDGHRAGIGCGHDLAVCRHDEAAIAAEIDDLASWNGAVRAALAATPNQVGAEGPAVDAVEALSRAIDWIKPEPGMDGPHGGHLGGVTRQKAVAAIEQGIAALRSGAEVAAAPGLDVGALEQILFERTNGKGRWRADLAPLIRESWQREAALIAAEYARLTAKP